MNNQAELTKAIDAYIRENLVELPFGIPWETAMQDRTAFTGASFSGGLKPVIDFLLKKMELTFSEKLLQLIKKKGRKSAEVYTKAGLTRAHFAKIKADKDYHPSKATALAFAIALHLDIDETTDLIKRAGYTISHSSEIDIIVEFFITNKLYDIDEINSQLCSRGHKPLTNWRQP